MRPSWPSELFHYDEGECSEMSDDEIAEFLWKLACSTPGQGTRRTSIRREVICDTVDLVVDKKHGHQGDRGVGLEALGMDGSAHVVLG